MAMQVVEKNEDSHCVRRTPVVERDQRAMLRTGCTGPFRAKTYAGGRSAEGFQREP